MKILVTGLGSIGQRHVRNLIQLYGDTIELSAYRTRGRDLVLDDSMTATFGTQPEEAYNIKTYKSLGRSLAEKPDAILVTNPNNLHMPTALSAAKQGCHLFIDKPLSDSLEGVSELQQIVATSQQSQSCSGVYTGNTVSGKERFPRWLGSVMVQTCLVDLS